jgi:hypothetical protein
MSPLKYQQGSILVLTLLMLLFIQLLATVVVNSTNISGHVLRNFESTVQAERSADNLINYLLANRDYFVNYSNYLNQQGEFEVSVPNEIVVKPAIASISSFTCLDYAPLTEDQAQHVNCGVNNKYWQIVVAVTNGQTGASIKVTQGVKLVVVTREVKAEGDSSAKPQKMLSAVQVQGVWWYAQ